MAHSATKAECSGCQIYSSSAMRRVFPRLAFSCFFILRLHSIQFILRFHCWIAFALNMLLYLILRLEGTRIALICVCQRGIFGAIPLTHRRGGLASIDWGRQNDKHEGRALHSVSAKIGSRTLHGLSGIACRASCLLRSMDVSASAAMRSP
jgi:hypothetical protein